MTKDTADYEESERIAIESGKKALAQMPSLQDRKVERTKGFFVELHENDAVHPEFYHVSAVDGIGTKLFTSAWSGKYRSAPQDGLAMAANDFAPLLRAYPATLILYLAMQTQVEEQHMGEIMEGFAQAAERIRIPNAPFNMNIGKIETASLDEIISLGVPGKGWDVGVALTGYIRKNAVPRLHPKPGHVIVGVSSTGLQSNGYTGARHVLFRPDPSIEYREEWQSQYKGRFDLHDKPAILKGQTVLEALQVPTALYLSEAHDVGTVTDLEAYGINITGNGLGNFNRAGKDVSFHITDPLPLLPIHELLAQESGWNAEKTYVKSNAGMGFAYIVPDWETADRVVKRINERGENKAQIVGEVRASNDPVLKTFHHKPYDGSKTVTISGYSS